MATGKVKWFNNAKGYGFVVSETSGEDLFAHFSSIQMDGYKTLKAGQDVQFDIEQGPKGLHAVNIRSTESQASQEALGEAHIDNKPSENDRLTKAAFSSSSHSEYAESR
jgi:CspA family cold shock protein